MTTVATPPVAGDEAPDLTDDAPRAAQATETADVPTRDRGRSVVGVAGLAVLWVLVVVLAIGIVLWAVEPTVQVRQQRRLLHQAGADIDRATNQATGLPGIEVPTEPPATGAPVGILQIASIGVEQAVAEGGSPSTTSGGPGHVIGTAGLGQAGDSVVVGRRTLFGGPFGSLDRVAPDDEIVVTTAQGQSRYRVSEVSERSGTPGSIVDGLGEEHDDATTAEEHGRLVVVTSASPLPWNRARATVVVADLEAAPFTATPQGDRGDDALSPEWVALVPIVLVAATLAATALVGIWLARRTSRRIAFLLIAVPLIGLAVVLAEQLSRLLPAWT